MYGGFYRCLSHMTKRQKQSLDVLLFFCAVISVIIPGRRYAALTSRYNIADATAIRLMPPLPGQGAAGCGSRAVDGGPQILSWTPLWVQLIYLPRFHPVWFSNFLIFSQNNKSSMFYIPCKSVKPAWFIDDHRRNMLTVSYRLVTGESEVTALLLYTSSPSALSLP